MIRRDNMKETYTSVDIEIIRFERGDVITYSDPVTGKIPDVEEGG